jgi:malate dehydrogenase (quinone)
MTPSPGATSCLGNAENDLELIAAHLQCNVQRDALQAQLHTTGEDEQP